VDHGVYDSNKLNLIRLQWDMFWCTSWWYNSFNKRVWVNSFQGGWFEFEF